jgi:hypothetical protein
VLAAGLAGVLCTVLLAAPTPWLTLDIVNPASVGGHRLLTLDDVLGPRRRSDIANLPVADALLIFSVSAADCTERGVCERVARFTEVARSQGALVIAVILASKEEAGAAAISVQRAQHPIAVTFDVHGLVRRAFDFEGPGVFSVIDGKGMNVATFRPSKAGGPARVAQSFEQIRVALLKALGNE